MRAGEEPDKRGPRGRRWAWMESTSHVLPALIGIAFVLSTIPVFFSNYRAAAFRTSPFDDYAPSVLAMIGQNGPPPHRIPTTLQASPVGYRILSVAAAVPFYYVLPYYAFSQLANPDEPYLRAEEAVCMVSYLAVLLTVLVVFLIARRRLGRSFLASLLVGLFSFGLFQFMETHGADPIAVLVISVLIYYIDEPPVFVPLAICSALINEKIFIIFAIVFAGRLLVWIRRRDRPYRYTAQTIATIVALAIYGAMKLTLRLPGYGNQTDPTTWLPGVISTISVSLSLKGAILNGVPLAIVGLLMVVALAVHVRFGPIPLLAISDLAVAPVLVVLGAMINMGVTVEHLVMHSFPLYLPLAAYVIADHDWEGVHSPRASARVQGDAGVG